MLIIKKYKITNIDCEVFNFINDYCEIAKIPELSEVDFKESYPFKIAIDSVDSYHKKYMPRAYAFGQKLNQLLLMLRNDSIATRLKILCNVVCEDLDEVIAVDSSSVCQNWNLDECFHNPIALLARVSGLKPRFKAYGQRLNKSFKLQLLKFRLSFGKKIQDSLASVTTDINVSANKYIYHLISN